MASYFCVRNLSAWLCKRNKAGTCLLLFLFLLVGCGKRGNAVYTSIEDVHTIGVLLGSAQDAYVTEHFPEAEIFRIEMSTDLISALEAGACDVAILERMEAGEIVKADDRLGILQRNLLRSPCGMAFSKEEHELRASFNEFLDSLHRSGLYDEMLTRWTDKGMEAEMPRIELPEKGTPLRVGTTGMSVPFTFLRDGKYVGLDIEVVSRFAAWLNRPLELEIVNFGGLIPAAISKKVDLIANSILITPEREKSVAFSQPYYDAESVIITLRSHLPSDEKEVSATTDDLSGKRVAVLNGSLFDAFLSKNYPTAEIQRLETETDMILALQKGRCDALLIDNVPFLAAQRNYGNMKVVDEALMTLDFGVAFRKDGTALRDRFNLFLKETRDSGLYDEIYSRWMLHTEEAVMPDIPLVANQNIRTSSADSPARALRIGIAGTTEPYAFVRNGRPVGFDIELLTRFAAHEGCTVDFEMVNFGGLVAALQSGKVDIASSGMAITEERKKAVAFSDPYFIGKGSLVVLANNDTLPSASGMGGTHSTKSLWQSLKESFQNNLIAEKRYQMILDGLGITLLISLLAAVAGTLFGGIICFLRMSRNRLLRFMGKTYIDLMRGTPVLVLLMLMYYVVFAPFGTSATSVAVITFSMNLAAYVSEMFRTSIEGIDRGQTEAGIALGFTRVQTFVYIVLPQAAKSVLPVYKGELISLLKTTSIVGYIAVVDLTKASDIIRSRTFDAFFPLLLVAVIYFVVSWLLGVLLDYLGRDKTNKQ